MWEFLPLNVAIPSKQIWNVFLFVGNVLHANIVETKLGLIEGITRESRNGTLFYAYYGIPYAKPPLGELRFEVKYNISGVSPTIVIQLFWRIIWIFITQDPVEATKWEGIFNATQKPLMCSQVPKNADYYDGQEDCIYVHVYTPLVRFN